MLSSPSPSTSLSSSLSSSASASRQPPLSSSAAASCRHGHHRHYQHQHRCHNQHYRHQFVNVFCLSSCSGLFFSCSFTYLLLLFSRLIWIGSWRSITLLHRAPMMARDTSKATRLVPKIPQAAHGNHLHRMANLRWVIWRLSQSKTISI